MVDSKSPAKAIAEETGYSEATVYLVAKRLGFKPRGRTEAQHEQLMHELRRNRIVPIDKLADLLLSLSQ